MEKFYFEIPSESRKDDAISYINEFYKYNSVINGTGGLQRYLDHYEEWLSKLDEDYTRIPNEESVPSRTYFLVRENDNKIVGMINIRLSLNEHYKKYNKHIGYSIRPTERGKGYNKINLYLGLKVCQKYGMDKVLLVASEDNIASWKTMEALGGINIGKFYDDLYAHGMAKNYEIDVNKSIKENDSIYEIFVKQDYEVVFESENIKYINLDYRLLDDYFIMINNPNITKFISHTPRNYTCEDERKWITEKLKTNAMIFSMIEKDTNTFIGNIELMHLNQTEGELGISITETMQNKHFGTEAIEAFVNYCFSTLNLERIILKVYPDNYRAIHVYQKLGFQIYNITEEDIYMYRRRDEDM